MTSSEPTFRCARCGRDREGKPDPAGWCDECRAGVVRQAEPMARAAGVVFAAALVATLWATGALVSRFLVVWLVVAGLVSFLAFKVARRIAFDWYRGRSAPPAPE